MWPFKKPKRFAQNPDRVWLTQSEKEVGIIEQIEQLPNTGSAILVISHFYSALTSLCEAFDRAGIDYEQSARQWTSEDAQRTLEQCEHRVLVIPGSCLPKDTLGSSLQPLEEGTREIQMISVERHPLSGEDIRIENFAQSLSCRSSLWFHISFEDGIMRMFARDWVAPMMKSLGLEKGQHIESGLVSRSLRKAQEKNAKRVIGDTVTESSEEWIQLNLESKS